MVVRRLCASVSVHVLDSRNHLLERLLCTEPLNPTLGTHRLLGVISMIVGLKERCPNGQIDLGWQFLDGQAGSRCGVTHREEMWTFGPTPKRCSYVLESVSANYSPDTQKRWCSHEIGWAPLDACRNRDDIRTLMDLWIGHAPVRMMGNFFLARRLSSDDSVS